MNVENSLKVRKSTNPESGQVETLIKVTGDNANEWFKVMMQRSMNTWDNAPLELKEFADVIIDGAPKQDYEAHALQTINSIPKTPYR